MGSLRNPIGPLPSSIYWRRRAVAVAILALLAVVVVWAVFRDGGESTSDDSKGGGGPAATITPGPSDSGPGITERPGGRDEESGSEASEGGSSGSDDGNGSDADDSKSGGSTGGSGWGDAGAGSGSDTAGGSGGEGAGSDEGGVPAGSSLPECREGDVEFSLKSVRKTYGSGTRPQFKLAAENNRATACKLDLGPTATVVTVKDSEGATVWASDHCPRSEKPAYVQLPANRKSTRNFSWYRKANAANCATPRSSSVSAGDYRIEVDLNGLRKVSAKFTLD